MLKIIEKAALAGKLTTVTCRDKITGEEVEILCLPSLDTPGGLRPIARLYHDTYYAMADVTSPGGYSDNRILH